MPKEQPSKLQKYVSNLFIGSSPFPHILLDEAHPVCCGGGFRILGCDFLVWPSYESPHHLTSHVTSPHHVATRPARGRTAVEDADGFLGRFFPPSDAPLGTKVVVKHVEAHWPFAKEIRSRSSFAFKDAD